MTTPASASPDTTTQPPDAVADHQLGRPPRPSMSGSAVITGEEACSRARVAEPSRPAATHRQREVAVGYEADRARRRRRARPSRRCARASARRSRCTECAGRRGDHRLRHDLADQHARRVYNRATVAYRSPAAARPTAPDRVADPARRARARPRPVRGRPRVADRRAQRDRPEPRAPAGASAARRATRVSDGGRATPRRTARLGGAPPPARRRSPRSSPRSACSSSTSPSRCCASDVPSAERPGVARARGAARRRRRPAVAADPGTSSTSTRKTRARCCAIGIGGFIGFVGDRLGGRLPRPSPRAAARHRCARRFLIYVPIVGGVVLGVGVLIVADRHASCSIDDFLAGPRTVAAATRRRATA